jgi:hypothetical protein
MKPPAGNFMDRLREEVERETAGCWLTSPLAEWMETHHAEAVQLLNHRNLDWEHAAELFAAQGLRDLGDKAPTAESARDTWKRVEARRRAGMKLRKSKA